MKTIRIVTVAVLMVASAWALHVLWAEQAVNTPACASRLLVLKGSFGMSINAAPRNPMTIPTTAQRVSGWPRFPNTPNPAIQNADVPLSSAD